MDSFQTFDLVTIRPADERWERNRSLGRGDGNCLVCNRRMNMDDPRNAMAHLTTYGHLFPVELELDDHPNTQGWFEVGPGCAKKLPAKYVSLPVNN